MVRMMSTLNDFVGISYLKCLRGDIVKLNIVFACINARGDGIMPVKVGAHMDALGHTGTATRGARGHRSTAYSHSQARTKAHSATTTR